jgi:predicted RNase H-like nuclease (RuvC/YqgF family)
LKNVAKGALAAAAAAAAIALIVVTIKAIDNYIHKYEKTAKSAAETTKNLKSAVEELTAGYENLKKSISDFSDGQKEIAKMQKGTLEWKEALAASNEQAKALIKTLDLIEGKDYTVDKTTGLININERNLKEA